MDYINFQIMKRIVCTLFLSLVLMGGNLWAQNAYTVYPVPQEQVQLKGKATFTPKVTVVAEDGIDIHTRERVSQILQENGLEAVFAPKAKGGQSAIYLGINGSKGAADRKATGLKLKRDVFSKEKYDRHIVSLNSNGGKAQVVILGENTDAVFYGLATLEQILGNGTANLATAVFYDYADVQYRGVIEGYYGVPYSMEVTEDLFRFMARYKLNMYMYGAKSDPYHTRYWDKAYPEKISQREERYGLMTKDMMSHLANVAHQCKVNFIWAIHPGQTFTELGESDVLDRIMSKFQLMYDLGVRQFGVFVDDVGVPYDTPSLKQCADRLSDLQNMIDQRWNAPGTPAADMVKPLQYVPQLYAYSWTTPDKARKFWESLNPVPDKVNIYTTGKNVWSVPNSTDLAVLNDYLGREVSWWWNYPCNDVDVTKIFVADTYANFADEKHIHYSGDLEKDLKVKTVIVNPMQQGELSKIPLFGVADYTWNMETFNNMENWKASLPAILGSETAPSFETIVPYLRYYDSLSPLAGLINEFKAEYAQKGSKASADALKGELGKIVEACKVVGKMKDSPCVSDSLFYADLRPFVLKLEAMAGNAGIMVDALMAEVLPQMTLVEFAKSWSAIEGMEKNENHRFDILRGMGSEITLQVQTAEPAAQALRPFLDWLLKEVGAKYGNGEN